MKYLHYVCQKYVVALEAKGIIKTERLANPCSISFANPTFTFSLVVWDKFCGQGAKILAQHLREIWLHLGKKYLLNFSKKYCCTWARCTRAGWKCIVKTGSQANPERPWVERQIPSCCSQQNRIFSSFLQFFQTFFFLTKLQDLCPQWAPHSLTEGNKEYFSIVKQFLTIYVPGTDLDIIFLTNRQGQSSVL